MAVHQALKFDFLKKNSRGKKLKTQGKNSVTQVKTQAFDNFILDSSFFLQIKLDFSHDITFFNHFERGYEVVSLKNEPVSWKIQIFD